jgi:metallothiol transferase
MIQPIGIDHVAINVKDLNRSLQFYTEVLGLKVSVREHQKPGTEYFLDCGPSLVGLIQANEKEPAHLLKHEGLGGNHFSFRVATQDFDRVVEELKRHNVTIDFTKKRELSWSCYFQDPDGNRLEITAWPKEDNR